MDTMKVTAQRHSVRRYKSEPIPMETRDFLRGYIDDLNKEHDLNFQLFFDTRHMFNRIQRLTRAKNVSNYLALVVPEQAGGGEKAGFFGSEFTIVAQTMGLNTWWVGGGYSRAMVASDTNLKIGQDMICIIAFGYGENQGVPHKSKTPEEVSSYEGEAPEWFQQGVKAALLAPTAYNKQDFMITGKGRKVDITYEFSRYGDIDLGIVKQHFQMGAGIDNFKWA